MRIYNNYELRIIDIIENMNLLLFKNPNVCSIGLGKKIINGKMTEMPSLTIYVKKKLPYDSLSRPMIIPKTIKGVYTDILEKYDHYTLLGKPIRPSYGGVAIGSIKMNKGTIAYAVTNKLGPVKKVFALTSAHVCPLVLEYNSLVSDSNEIMYQPNITDVKEEDSNSFSTGIISVPITLTGRGITYEKNKVDAATSIIRGSFNEARKKLQPGIWDSEKNKMIIIKDIATDIKEGESIYKIGSETGKTKGVVTTTKGISNEDFSSIAKVNKEKGITRFYNQITCKIHSQTGDSGALGIREKDDAAFGMLMSGDGLTSTFNDISIVLNLLSVEFLKP